MDIAFSSGQWAVGSGQTGDGRRRTADGGQQTADEKSVLPFFVRRLERALVPRRAKEAVTETVSWLGFFVRRLERAACAPVVRRKLSRKLLAG